MAKQTNRITTRPAGTVISIDRFLAVLDALREQLTAATWAPGTANERTARTTARPSPAPPRIAFRYHSALRANQRPEHLPLSETRLKVLKALHRSHKSGLLAREIMDRTGLPHGSIQQTLNWLRSNKLVKGAPEE